MDTSAQLQSSGISPELQNLLRSRNIVTAKDLFTRTPFDLVETLDLPYDVVHNILNHSTAGVVPPPTTALHLLEQSQAPASNLRTTLPPLDAALQGGLPAGSITEIVGPAGLGKSQFCMTMTVIGCVDRMGTNGKVLYIDTERKFSAERLREIALERFPTSFPNLASVGAFLDHVLLKSPGSSTELLQLIEGLERAIVQHNISLIVIDSIAALARADYDSTTIIDRQRMLGQQASRLKYLAEAFKIPILVSNQVTALIGAAVQQGPAGAAAGGIQRPGSAATAALGPMWAHAVNTRLVLQAQRDMYGKQMRVLTVAKSPSSPNIALAYQVTAAGPVWLEGVTPPPVELGSVIDMVITNERGYEEMY